MPQNDPQSYHTSGAAEAGEDVTPHLEERPHRTANGGNRVDIPARQVLAGGAMPATPREHNRQTSAPDAANTKSSKPLPRRRHGRTGQR